jgi:hypothetical protein
VDEESLSLAWVEHDQGWVVTFLNVECGSELWFSGSIQEAEIE